MPMMQDNIYNRSEHLKQKEVAVLIFIFYVFDELKRSILNKMQSENHALGLQRLQ